MLRAHILSICLAFGLMNCAPVISDANAQVYPPQFNVGYQVLDLESQKEGQALTVAVWYPTAV